MKKGTYLLIGLVIVVQLFLFVGCKTKTVYVPAQSKVIETTKIIHERDTTIQIEADSSWYKAWIECQNGKPILKNPSSQKGNGKVQAPVVTLDTLGQLNVNCFTENIQLKFKIVELETLLKEKETISIEVEKPLTPYQQILINLGKIFGAILIGLLVYGAFKLVKKYYV